MLVVAIALTPLAKGTAFANFHWIGFEIVENLNFYFLTPLSHNFKMLHFDANPITMDISGYRIMKDLSMLKTI